MQVTILDNLAAILARAEAWDDLWLRSDAALPSARARLLAQWVEQFAPGAKFCAVLVERDGKLLAVLPLVGRRIAGLMEVGALPSNDWSASGDLLLDRQANAADVMDCLAEGLRQLPWPLLQLSLTRQDAPAWQALSARCDANRIPQHRHDQYEIGVVELTPDFAAYETSWSGNHRRHMGKARRRLERDGGDELQVYSSLMPDEVEPLLLAGFQIEDNSWKGAQRTSVLQAPGMFEFYRDQARQLAAWGQLRLVFLTHRGRPIAFEYGWMAKGRYFTPKVAFDPEFAQYTPSQLLRYRLYERFSREPAPPTVDFLGPLSEATAKWATGRYSIGTMLLGLRPIKGRAIMYTYRLLRSLRQSWRSLRATKAEKPAVKTPSVEPASNNRPAENPPEKKTHQGKKPIVLAPAADFFTTETQRTQRRGQ